MIETITLATLAHGGLAERFEDALQRVLQNIQDPNTDAKATRKITVVLTWKPEKDRSSAGVGVEVKTSLADHEGVATTVFMGFDGDRVVAHEHNPQQAQLFPETSPMSDNVHRLKEMARA